MIRLFFVKRLLEDNLISEEQHQKIVSYEESKVFSLHWELRILLYTGILLLTSGLGIIIYKNIDTIGHTAIILAIAAACAGCFVYCFRNRQPYSNSQVIYTSPWFDYILLLGCLLFLALEGYLQYQYNLFGTRYGLATLLPAILFFGFAYLFDHAGILSLGITALAAYAGITVSPGILVEGSLAESALVHTGIALSVFLIGVGFLMKLRNIKRHFTFSYYNFGFNMYFICMLSAMFTLNLPFLYFGFLVLGGILLSRYAIFEKSFYFLLMAVVYSYIGFTWAVFQLELYEIFGLYYFVVSCVGVIWFFINYKKILKVK